MSEAVITPSTPVAVARADLSPYHDDRIALWSDYRLKESIKEVPGARWDSDNRVWTVPRTWPACLALRKELGKSLIIEAGLAAWASEERVLKDTLHDLRNRLVDGVELPDVAGEPFDSLYPHQRSGALAAMMAKGYALFDDMGTGKGRTTLVALRLAEAAGEEVFPVLIVAPKSMLGTWARDEIPRFFPAARISVISGTPKKVKTAMEPGFDFYLSTYDTVRNYSRHAPWPTLELTDEEKKEKELNALGFKTVVADEVQRIINPESKQTRAIWHLGEHANFRIGLTGTPIQDTPEDLWSILHWLAPDEYRTKTPFVERFLSVHFNQWGGREISGLNPLNEEEFRRNAEARFRRAPKAVVLPHLPPKIFETRWVELPPKFRKAYDSMAATLVAELETGTLVAGSVLEAANRLVQLANSGGTATETTVTDEDGNEKIKRIFVMEAPSPKIDAFMEDVLAGDYTGQQVVVFSDSRQLADLLSEAFTAKKIGHAMITGGVTGDDRQRAMDSFQAGEIPFIIITRAGGEGVTLTAASTMVRLVRAWSYIVHSQSEDRVHRIGSEIHESITYVDYITADTVEEGQLARLYGKKERATEVLRDDELLALLKK